MKLVKSLLLGSAAGLAAVAGAQAADLPVKKAAPVEYVRVCSAYGAGFFYIPGTETCLRVGGRVRADYVYVEPEFREDDAIGFRTRGRIQLDARTATAYGLLRTFVRFEMTRDTGAFGSSSTTANVDQAFVQFGGLTAGRAITMFDNGDIDAQTFRGVRWNDQPTVNMLAYTFSFGNGFSATLSLEEGEFDGISTFADATDISAGQRMPDVVANVRYAGTWGSAQLSGALHQLRSVALFDAAGVGFIPDTEYGFAVSGQFNFNLPMLGAGDNIWLAATYADGALGYLGFSSTEVRDAAVDVDGDIDTTKGWQVAGGIRHFWTPEIRQNVFASYAKVEYGAGLDGFDFNEWQLGTNVIWSPVSGLNIGAEVQYINQDFDLAGADNDDFWTARLRVQRDF